MGLKYGTKILWPQISFWSDRFFLVTGNEYSLADSIKK